WNFADERSSKADAEAPGHDGATGTRRGVAGRVEATKAVEAPAPEVVGLVGSVVDEDEDIRLRSGLASAHDEGDVELVLRSEDSREPRFGLRSSATSINSAVGDVSHVQSAGPLIGDAYGGHRIPAWSVAISKPGDGQRVGSVRMSEDFAHELAR